MDFGEKERELQVLQFNLCPGTDGKETWKETGGKDRNVTQV